MIVRKLLVCIIATFAVAVASAHDFTDAFPMSRIDRNPATLSMGGAGVASLSSLAWSSYENPAIIPFMKESVAGNFSYLYWKPEVSSFHYYDFGMSYEVSNVGFTLGGSYGRGESYDYYSESNPSVSSGTFTPDDRMFNSGISFMLCRFLSFGVNFRFMKSGLSKDDDFQAITSDMFIMTDFSFTDLHGLRAAFGVTNQGITIRGASDANFDMSSSIVLGVSYSPEFLLNNALELNLDEDYYYNSKAVSFSFGAQYGYCGRYFIRGGFRYGGSTVIPSFISFGPGIRYSGLSLDSAFIFGFSGLKSGMSFGLGYSF
jgi:hypothetical protein